MRLYVIASAQHNSPFGSEPAKDDSQFLVNPLPAGDVLRALMVAMDLWVTKAIPPPPSRYPTVKDRTLVPPITQRFSENSRRKLRRPAQPPTVSRLRQTHSARQDGDAPTETAWQGAYEILVPKVDADGNDIAGIRLPAIEVPIGTYTGWNLRPRGLAEGDLSGLLGSFIPFAKTKIATAQDRRSAPVA